MTTRAGTTTRLEFTEDMRGYIGFGRKGFREGTLNRFCGVPASVRAPSLGRRLGAH